MWDYGSEITNKDMAPCIIITVINMKESGIRTNVKVRGFILLRAVHITKGNGQTIKRAAKVSLIGETERLTTVCG